MLFLGGIFYIGLLLINAVAVLSEDRFLARIGWSSVQPPNNVGFHQNYDHNGSYGNPIQDIGVKGRLINLISAVRTVMRIPLIGINIVVIIYELILGK
ncbi:Yos1-like protein [Multifurca ochricompacta]|uniref:Yos1-like protein n=1 Tax=Multifurca ochricompacta TaxID=376703 RepID=A0AAD4MCH4_9AGAM|nr:Yos1-like protein [Multifurca ochricompacta]